MGQDTYHVVLGKRRTTVSLDKIISILLGLKLGHDPGTKDAHSAVREYLQDKLDEKDDPKQDYVSQWLRKEVFLDLLDKKLSERYERWFDEKHSKWFQATYSKKRRRVGKGAQGATK